MPAWFLVLVVSLAVVAVVAMVWLLVLTRHALRAADRRAMVLESLATQLWERKLEASDLDPVARAERVDDVFTAPGWVCYRLVTTDRDFGVGRVAALCRVSRQLDYMLTDGSPARQLVNRDLVKATARRMVHCWVTARLKN